MQKGCILLERGASPAGGRTVVAFKEGCRDLLRGGAFVWLFREDGGLEHGIFSRGSSGGKLLERVILRE